MHSHGPASDALQLPLSYLSGGVLVGRAPCFLAGGGSVLLDQHACNRCLPASFHAVLLRALSRWMGRAPTPPAARNTHRGARTHNHKVKSLALYRLS